MSNEEFIEVKEGLVKLLVPNPELFKRSDGVYEPSWAPVFYNPRMTFNRDLSVIILQALTNLSYLRDVLVLDALAGTGVRGLRYVKEVNGVNTSLINDIDPLAYKLMVKNIELNGLKDRVKAYNKDANILMNELKLSKVKVNFIDIDPFGSPIPYLQSALWLVTKDGVLAVTATDTAVLTGKHAHALLKKYRAIGFKTDFKNEFAARVLLSSIAFRASEMDKYIVPLFTISTEHYVRVFVKVGKGGKKAYDMVKNKVGYVHYCTKCCYRVFVGIDEEVGGVCPYCGGKLARLGPLWISSLYDEQLVKGVDPDLLRRFSYVSTYIKLTKFLKFVRYEYSINQPYYSLPKLCSNLGINIPKLSKVIECLRNAGYSASRTHMDQQGIKTDAPYGELIKCVKGL